MDDFIQLAREGKDVQVGVNLMKLSIKQKVHPEETEEAAGEMDSYLLLGDYTFKVKEEAGRIRKVYSMGFRDESPNTGKIHPTTPLL